MTALLWIAVALGYLFGSLLIAIAVGRWLHHHTSIGDQDRATDIPYLPVEATIRRHPSNVRRIDSKVTVPRRHG